MKLESPDIISDLSVAECQYVQEYDAMLVPPIWLEDYPKPCYPEELRVVSNLFCVLPQLCLLPQKTLQVA
ncbi:hypothetical protein VKI21_03165 [Cyanobacterium aponinum UTEX 3222]|uniref:hypothetical protein n=1 Tax=Cyanobacterium aponinum TaxID=379064 RepID=UPI000C12D2DF|nr:hypothetical protein [Cyanobacterium aponinum]PHV61646.1 hypothetical protein CSQ80_14445 [Cyanobacterium aponinum IPPAS B-1201]WRL39859.1 hypothetical protein VKI22_07200 [Cyanobacterium aponinum UTEX 3221]WRL42703.1 hypothetical protein VKI21_03165 [Cyanobacterium aponinum UTEX 3222]